MVKVVVLLPLSWRLVLDDFMFSLLGMVRYSLGRYRLQIIRSRMSYGDNARNYLVNRALVMKPDYVLWLDGDQTYPDNLPELLIKHIDGGKEIVGGWVGDRTSRLPILADFVKPDDRNDFKTRLVKEVRSGLFKVDCSNLGGFMMKPSVFDKLAFPWFKTILEGNGPDDPDGTWIPEDVYFYRKCKDAGIDVWIDGDLQFGHLDIVEKKSFVRAGDAGSVRA